MVKAVSRMKQWMIAVKSRDKKCTKCGTTEELQVHRVKESQVLHPPNDAEPDADWRFNLDNGVTLCATCAKKRNTTHGEIK
jgi:hypothetical protein